MYLSLDRNDFGKIPAEWMISEGGFEPASVNTKPLKDPEDATRGLMKIELMPEQSFGFVMPQDLTGGVKWNHKPTEIVMADKDVENQYYIDSILSKYKDADANPSK